MIRQRMTSRFRGTWALGHCPGPVDNFGQTREKVPDAIDEPDFRNSL